MASSFYDEMALAAVELLAEFGAPATLKKTTGAYDPARSEVDPGSQTNNGTAIRTNYAQRDIDGTNVRQGDARIVLSLEGSAEDPETGDTLVFDSTSFNVISVNTIRPANKTIVFIVQGRA